MLVVVEEGGEGGPPNIYPHESCTTRMLRDRGEREWKVNRQKLYSIRVYSGMNSLYSQVF